VTRTLHPWRSLSPTINDVGEEFRVAHAGVGELRDRCALGDPRLADLAAVDLLNAELKSVAEDLLDSRRRGIIHVLGHVADRQTICLRRDLAHEVDPAEPIEPVELAQAGRQAAKRID